MKTVPAIRFTAKPYFLEEQLIIRLPDVASKSLPSRGQVAVVLTIQDMDFIRVLEPDGNWGHWLKIDNEMQSKITVRAETSIEIALEVTKQWPEPQVPDDLRTALAAAPQKVKEKWQDITAMARWEWVRWINETRNEDTRVVRIEKTISKLNGNHRRPCCFNLAACTDPRLSKSGRLMGIMDV